MHVVVVVRRIHWDGHPSAADETAAADDLKWKDEMGRVYEVEMMELVHPKVAAE